MPFTAAHPAAVLPLVGRRPFVAAALVAGSVAPDVPYFLRRARIPVSADSWYEPYLNATTSHSLAGLLPVALPLALVLWLAWLVSRRPLLALLPDDSPGQRLHRVHLGWAVLSLLIGILTHLAWDAFTHGDGWIVTHVPFLRETVTGDLTWSRLLQHVSTVIGLLVLAVYLHRHRPPLAGSRLPLAAAAVSIAVVAGAVLSTRPWWTGANAGLPRRAVIEGTLSDAATGAGLAVGLLLTVHVSAWWLRQRWTEVRQDASGDRPGPDADH